MADTKIGFNQLNTPAPLWYRRFANAMIIAIIPATVGLIQGWGFSTIVVNHALQLSTLCAALIKALGMFLGNGQTYTPSNDAVDAAKPKP